MSSFLDLDGGTDPASAAREAAEAITAAREVVEERGIKAFLFNAASPEEFDERASIREVAEVLDEVSDLYLSSREGHAKLTAALRREFVASKAVQGVTVHKHNGGCGDLHKFQGEAWADEALLRPENGGVEVPMVECQCGARLPSTELDGHINLIHPPSVQASSDPCGGCPAGTKCVCTHDGCKCVKTASSCGNCGKGMSDFRDDESIREASVSGMCQDCQDDYFGSEKVAKYDPDWEAETPYWETMPHEADDACVDCEDNPGKCWCTTGDKNGQYGKMGDFSSAGRADKTQPQGTPEPDCASCEGEGTCTNCEGTLKDPYMVAEGDDGSPRESGKPMYIFNEDHSQCPKCGMPSIILDDDGPYCEGCNYKAPPGTEGEHVIMGPVRRQRESSVHQAAWVGCPSCGSDDTDWWGVPGERQYHCKDCGNWIDEQGKKIESSTKLPDWITAAFDKPAAVRKTAGGSDFSVTEQGKTAEEAFRRAVESAQYESGHGGYTGTIAEKGDFRIFTPPKGVKPQEFLKNFHEFSNRVWDEGSETLDNGAQMMSVGDHGVDYMRVGDSRPNVKECRACESKYVSPPRGARKPKDNYDQAWKTRGTSAAFKAANPDFEAGFGSVSDGPSPYRDELEATRNARYNQSGGFGMSRGGPSERETVLAQKHREHITKAFDDLGGNEKYSPFREGVCHNCGHKPLRQEKPIPVEHRQTYGQMYDTYNDKWGAAVAVPLGKGSWHFMGVASD